MLVVLPACFALGFLIGYVLSRWGSSIVAGWGESPAQQASPARPDPGEYDLLSATPPTAIGAARENSWIWIALALFALVAFAAFASGWATSGHLLEFGAVVVGVLAAIWFNDPSGSRDKLIFLAAAGGFLFLAALEYDHKVFGSLAKIGGGGVSVEFSDKGRRGADERPLIAASQGYLGKVFPGNSGVTLAIGSLKDLPISIMIDEYYSVLFSANSISKDYSKENSGRWHACLRAARATCDFSSGPNHASSCWWSWATS